MVPQCAQAKSDHSGQLEEEVTIGKSLPRHYEALKKNTSIGERAASARSPESTVGPIVYLFRQNVILVMNWSVRGKPLLHWI